MQGVWFRESCRREALTPRGVAGWVANRSDGPVEAVFEGPEPAVAEMVAWCRMGPPRAEVTGIDVSAGAVEGWPASSSGVRGGQVTPTGSLAGSQPSSETAWRQAKRSVIPAT